jgi:hypothetical protein
LRVERSKKYKRGLLIGAAVLVTAGAVTVATVQRDDAGEGRGRAAQETGADDDDEQPPQPPLAGSAESPAPAADKRRHSAPAPTPLAPAPGEPRAPLPVSPGHAVPAIVATKEPVSRQGHSGAAHPGAVRPSASATAHPDGGAPAAQASSPDGGVRAGQKVASASLPRADSSGFPDDSRSDFVRVARFANTGGASLQGRVVDADSGRPVSGAVVEAVLAERFIEGRTDAGGTFQMAGMLPGTRVRIWVGGKHDPFVAERIDVGVPSEGQVADAGVIRLVRGDELASRLDGWVGLFVARRGGRVQVSAVSPWLPADRAGVQVGDWLVSIDGRDVAGLGPRAVAFLLRGPPLSSVALVVDGHDGTRRKLSLERVVR